MTVTYILLIVTAAVILWAVIAGSRESRRRRRAAEGQIDAAFRDPKVQADIERLADTSHLAGVIRQRLAEKLDLTEAEFEAELTESHQRLGLPGDHGWTEAQLQLAWLWARDETKAEPNR